METICELSVPVDLGGGDMEYSVVECGNTGLYEYIENTTTSASFYLEKSFTYGDFFLMGFLTLFALFKAVEIIWSNFIKSKWIF